LKHEGFSSKDDDESETCAMLPNFAAGVSEFDARAGQRVTGGRDNA
jgi:hypothetical protein